MYPVASPASSRGFLRLSEGWAEKKGILFLPQEKTCLEQNSEYKIMAFSKNRFKFPGMSIKIKESTALVKVQLYRNGREREWYYPNHEKL
jgi:hypothetical protein